MASLVFSFAVFDACLVRLHARPLDQLFSLARQVLPSTRGDPDRDDQHEFVRLRLQAEDEAREASGLEAVGLGMVYERFPRDNPWDLEPEQLHATELSLALADARPVPTMRERVRGHVRRGERVVYVSDSIVPGASLRRLLESHGFAGEVYAAGDLGKRKGSGSLYRHVLAAEGLEPGQLEHTGSDPALDGRVPTGMGIRTRLFPEARFTATEDHLRGLHRVCSPEFSRIVAASRLARLRGEAPPDMGRVRAFAADVAAPVLTAFTAWAMAGAERSGASRIYFLAREGELPFQVARVLRPVIGGPEPHYLMGSLRAFVAPLAAGLDREDLNWLAAESRTLPPERLLAKLSITPEELLRASGRRMPELLSDRPLSRQGLDELWDILEEPESRRLLAVRAAEARGAAMAYLRSQGALDGPVLAVADMGWTLHTQRALRRVLAGTGVDVEGWYFGLASHRLGRMEAGAHHALFMERAGHSGPGSLETALFANVRLLERVFARGGHGRVLGYEEREGGIRPVLGPDPPGLAHTREIQDTVLAYAEALAGSGFGEAAFQALLETARDSLRSFLLTPDPALAQAVAEVDGADDPSSPLLRPLRLMDVLEAWLGRGKPPDAASRLWVEGSMAVSSGWMRPVLRRQRVQSLLRTWFG